MEISPLQLVTGAVALYGALLSTMAFITSLQSRRSRVRVGVWLGEGVVNATGEPVAEQVVITATNVGEVDTLLLVLGAVHARPLLLWRFRCKWRRLGIVPAPQLDRTLPKKLSPSEQVTILLPASEFMPSMSWPAAEARLLFEDSYGKHHYSPPLSRCLREEHFRKYRSDSSAERTK